jgi:hypothetical protein
MPSIKDHTTVQAIAREYCSNGRNKTEAMVKVGYTAVYANGGRGQGMVYGNERVIEAIKAIDGAGAEQSERTVQSIDTMYQRAYDLAETTKQSSSMVSACTGIARLYGMDKDTQANPDQPLPLTKQELDQATRAANVVLSQDKSKTA